MVTVQADQVTLLNVKLKETLINMVQEHYPWLMLVKILVEVNSL